MAIITFRNSCRAGIIFAAIISACANDAAPAPATSATNQTRQVPRGVRRYDKDWFDAARVGRIDLLQGLLRSSYPIDAQTDAGYSALVLAAYNDQLQALDFLLKSGANPCLADHQGNTALMGALFKGYNDIVHRLLEAGCNIDQANNAGETALSFAALFGRLALLPELVAAGANPNHVDARGITALAMASIQGNNSAEVALRKAGETR
jgi:ankyrin repeat protein